MKNLATIALATLAAACSMHNQLSQYPTDKYIEEKYGSTITTFETDTVLGYVKKRKDFMIEDSLGNTIDYSAIKAIVNIDDGYYKFNISSPATDFRNIDRDSMIYMILTKPVDTKHLMRFSQDENNIGSFPVDTVVMYQDIKIDSVMLAPYSKELYNKFIEAELKRKTK